MTTFEKGAIVGYIRSGATIEQIIITCPYVPLEEIEDLFDKYDIDVKKNIK